MLHTNTSNFSQQCLASSSMLPIPLQVTMNWKQHSKLLKYVKSSSSFAHIKYQCADGISPCCVSARKKAGDSWVGKCGSTIRINACTGQIGDRLRRFKQHEHSTTPACKLCVNTIRNQMVQTQWNNRLLAPALVLSSGRFMSNPAVSLPPQFAFTGFAFPFLRHGCSCNDFGLLL